MLAAFVALMASVAFASADTILNAQEQAIAAHMINDSDQGRPFLTLDPILAGVARSRAEDMAKRNYFGHVNPDGDAANYLVQQAGYQLPSYWGNDPTSNYVESIAAGYASPDATWDAWMNSPEHKTHILGQNSFYAAETSYGIGYYYDPNSTYKYYWVIITAPPQPTPSLSITSPTPGARVTQSSVAVTGQTSDGSGTAFVELRVENANGSGAYQRANGTSNWSSTIGGLLPGTNTIHVRSHDSSGAVIAELTRNVKYVVMGSLTVAVSGSGSVTNGFLGTTSREVGSSCTLTATPAQGCVFAGWSGGVTSSKPTITFTMQDGLNLQANFILNPFLSLKGNYSGLVSSAAHSGILRATLSSGGMLTGRVTVDHVGYAFTAHVGLDGAVVATIPRKGLTPLTLNLQLDLTGGTEQITGTVSEGNFTADVSADHGVFDALTNPAPQTGAYTMVLTPDPSQTGANVPQGDGFATIKVHKSGIVRAAGRLADGTAFTQSSVVSKNGNVPIYLNLANAPSGSAATGTLTFRSTSESDLDGTIDWLKTPRASDAFYPDGFSAQLPAVGARYTPPASGTRALDVTQASPNAIAALGDGNLTQPIAVETAVTTSNEVVTPAPSALDLSAKINPATGIFTGKFTHPATNLRRGLQGVVLQKQNAAFGFFRGIDQSGYFSLAPDSGN